MAGRMGVEDFGLISGLEALADAERIASSMM